MKKSIFATVVILVLCAALLCACSGKPNLKKLNDMAAESYSQTKLSVRTVFPDASLNSTFDISHSGTEFTVKFRLEKFAELAIDKPTDLKEVVEGTAVVQEGAVSIVSGIELNKIVKIGMDFQNDYFANLQLTETRLSADVTNPTAFFGVSTFDGSNVKVNVGFGEVLQTLEVTYLSANGASVTLSYEFTK